MLLLFVCGVVVAVAVVVDVAVVVVVDRCGGCVVVCVVGVGCVSSWVVFAVLVSVLVCL